MMAKRRLGLLAPIPAEDEKDLMLKEYHQSWRKTNTDSSGPFIPLFATFKEKHLADLDGGPLRLYLFFAFAAKNQYGHSWHGIKSIAKFFGTQTRTVDNWIKVLVEQNLIYREQNGRKANTTYLIPYSNTLLRHQLSKQIEEDNQRLLDGFVNKIKEREFLYGPIVDVLHFFQWGATKKDKPIKERNIQWLVIITKRTDDVLIGHYYLLKNSANMGVNELEIVDIATFPSPFQLNGETIRGVAITHSIRLLDSNTDIILTFLDKVVDDSWVWNEYPSLDYDEVAQFFSDEEEEIEETDET
jgi:DNA-binding MarR family transcriptional regulator